MDRFAEKYSTKSNKFFNYNYSQSGYYFITLCTYYHNNLFGKIIDNNMSLTKQGKIVREELLKTISIRKNIIIDPWVVMPNHIHLLITLRNIHVETPRGASLQGNQVYPTIIPTHKNHPEFFKRLNIKSNQEIPKLINQYKSCVTRRCKKNNLFFSWQSGYYDVIIKDTKQLTVVKNYIISNPINWQKDKLFTNHAHQN